MDKDYTIRKPIIHEHFDILKGVTNSEINLNMEQYTGISVDFSSEESLLNFCDKIYKQFSCVHKWEYIPHTTDVKCSKCGKFAHRDYLYYKEGL